MATNHRHCHSVPVAVYSEPPAYLYCMFCGWDSRDGTHHQNVSANAPGSPPRSLASKMEVKDLVASAKKEESHPHNGRACYPSCAIEACPDKDHPGHDDCCPRCVR